MDHTTFIFAIDSRDEEVYMYHRLCRWDVYVMTLAEAWEAASEHAKSCKAIAR